MAYAGPIRMRASQSLTLEDVASENDETPQSLQSPPPTNTKNDFFISHIPHVKNSSHLPAESLKFQKSSTASMFVTRLSKRFIYGDPTQIPPRRLSANVTVVLDLDDTLIHFANGTFIIRPFVGKFLKRLQDNQCEIIIWSAAERTFVGLCLQIVDPTETLIDFAICRDESWLSPPSSDGQNYRFAPWAEAPMKNLNLIGSGEKFKYKGSSSRLKKDQSSLIFNQIEDIVFQNSTISVDNILENVQSGGGNAIGEYHFSNMDFHLLQELYKIPHGSVGSDSRKDTIIMVDDNPSATICNSIAAIIVPSFTPKSDQDARFMSDSVLDVAASAIICGIHWFHSFRTDFDLELSIKNRATRHHVRSLCLSHRFSSQSAANTIADLIDQKIAASSSSQTSEFPSLATCVASSSLLKLCVHPVFQTQILILM